MIKRGFTPHSLIEEEIIYRNVEEISDFLCANDNVKQWTTNYKFVRENDELNYYIRNKEVVNGVKDDKYYHKGKFRINEIESMSVVVDEIDDTVTITLKFSRPVFGDWVGNIDFFKGRLIYKECKNHLSILKS